MPFANLHTTDGGPAAGPSAYVSATMPRSLSTPISSGVESNAVTSLPTTELSHSVVTSASARGKSFGSAAGTT
jgi:hypothetical protein